MNGRDKAGDHCMFNANRVLMTANHAVVASCMILMMTDGPVLLTVVHQSSPKHRLISVTGEGRP